MPDKWRLYVYRYLVVVIALLAVSGTAVAAFELPFFWLVVSVLLGLAAGAIARNWKFVVILGVIPVLCWFYVDFRESKPNSKDLGNGQLGRLVVLQAVVDEPAKLDGHGRTELIVKVHQVVYPQKRQVSGKCIIRCVGEANVCVGDFVEAKVLLDKDQTQHQAWEFNKTEYLRRRGASQSAWLSKLDDLHVIKQGERNWLYAAKQAVVAARKHLVETHCRHLGETEGALLTSMVIGDRAVNLPDTLVAQFRDVGLSHVLAASGFNLTIVSGCTLFLVGLVLKNIWLRNIACLLSMLAFVAMAGPSPSVLRSAIMLCVLLIYRTFNRQGPISMALAAALLVAILIDPMCIKDVGFQLSYVATAAIVVGVEPVRKILGKAGDGFGIVELISVIVVAQMGVLPIQLYYFWCLGLFFLPANLLVAPFVHLVTLSGFASSLLVLIDQHLGWFQHLIWFTDKVISYPLMAIIACVKFMASFEQAKLVLGVPHIACLVFYYLTFVLFLLALKMERWRVISTGLILVAICSLAWRPVPTSPAIGFFKNSLVILGLDRRALVLGCMDTPALKKFLLYHGAVVSPETSLKVEHGNGIEQIYIPEIRTLVVRTQGDALCQNVLPKQDKFATLVLAIAGKTPSQAIDILQCNEQFSSYVEREKRIWLVFDRALSKKVQTRLASRLPSCVKIATRTGESLVFEASNESIEIRN